MSCMLMFSLFILFVYGIVHFFSMLGAEPCARHMREQEYKTGCLYRVLVGLSYFVLICALLLLLRN